MHSIFKTKITSNIIVISLSILLSSCVTQRALNISLHKEKLTALEEFANKKPCCVGLKNLPYQEILDNNELLEFNIADPIYKFKSGASYFKAFTLPKFKKPYEVEFILRRKNILLTTEIKKSVYFKGADLRVFMPAILLLDKNYNIIKSYDATNLKFTENKFINMTKPIRLSITIPSAKSHYMVIYTKSSYLKKYYLDIFENKIVNKDTFFPESTNISIYTGSIGYNMLVTTEERREKLRELSLTGKLQMIIKNTK